jgi:hypothetical protein
MYMKTLRITPQEQAPIGNERQMALPAAIGFGGVRMVHFKTGLSMSLSDYRLNSETVMEYVSFPDVFGFGFCLSGDISSRPVGFGRSDDIRSGLNALFHLDGDKMRETVGTRRVIRLNIVLEPQRLEHLFQNASEEVLSVLHELARRPQRLFGHMTPAMRSTVLQIIDCPYQGITREYFLESKALELVAYKLDQLGGESTRLTGGHGLKDEDVDRARSPGN